MCLVQSRTSSSMVLWQKKLQPVTKYYEELKSVFKNTRSSPIQCCEPIAKLANNHFNIRKGN